MCLLPFSPMNPLRHNALLAIVLLLGLWLTPSLRAVNEGEAQMYERLAMRLRTVAAEAMQKAEDAPGEASTLLTKVSENFKALADSKARIAKKIRSGNQEGLDDLKRADMDLAQKALQIREQLQGMGVALAEGSGGGRMVRRMDSRERSGSPDGEASPGGFRPRERLDRKPGVVVLGSTDELRNWLNEEEARDGGAK